MKAINVGTPGTYMYREEMAELNSMRMNYWSNYRYQIRLYVNQ